MVIAAAMLASAMPLPEGEPGTPVSITTHDIVEVADITGPSLSPDGTRVLYRISRPSVRANDTQLDWYVADVGGDAVVHAGDAGAVRHDGAGSVAEAKVLWDPDSRGFRFLALRDGIVAIWHWRENGGTAREIVDAADILDFSLSEDGRTLRYTTSATRAEVAAAEKRAYDEGVLVDDSVDLGQAVAGGKIEDGRRIAQRWTRNWFDRARILWDAPRKDTAVDLGVASRENAQQRGFTRAVQPEHADLRAVIKRQRDIAEDLLALDFLRDADHRKNHLGLVRFGHEARR